MEVIEEGGNLRLRGEPQRKTTSALAGIGISGYIGPKLDLDAMDPAHFAGKQ